LARGIGLNVEKATEDGILAKVVGPVTMLRRKDGSEGWYNREDYTCSDEWVKDYIEFFDPEKTVKVEG